jgi:hypothetical protein
MKTRENASSVRERCGRVSAAMIAACLAAVILAGCDDEQKLSPATSFTCAQQHGNYVSPAGAGSCLFCAVEDVLAYNGLQAEAAYWRAHFSGPALLDPQQRSRPIAAINELADRRGLPYEFTVAGDAAFLDRCSDNGRPAAIYWRINQPRDHAVTFLGFADRRAFWIDNNTPGVNSLPRGEFLHIWRGCGGGAWTVVTASPAWWTWE